MKQPLLIVTVLLGVAFCSVSLGGASSPAEPGEEVISGIIAEGVSPPSLVPDRGDEGEGPFARLVIRDVMIIDGTGAEPYGPATVVVENDRIVTINSGEDRNTSVQGAKVIEAQGQYLLPGFVDAHVHFGSTIEATYGRLTNPEYIAKLWLAHGITSVRDASSKMGLNWTLLHKRRSAAGEITAPRIIAYSMFPQLASVNTPAKARAWVRTVRGKGADGVKFILDSQRREKWGFPLPGEVVSLTPEVHLAAIDEAKTLGMAIAVHHGPTQTLNVLDHARLGVSSTEHLIGVAEDQIFGLPKAQPGSKKWHDIIAELIALDFTLVPTFAIVEAARDVMRVSRAEWHDEYAMPDLSKAFLPNPKIHGSFYLDWTTTYEVAGKNNLNTAMRFVKEYKQAGGRVAAGSDAGFIYQLYGFGLVREFEMLQEAGLSPLEVIQSATQSGAQLLQLSQDVGTVEVGKKADLVLVPENPLPNFKLLYGTGHMRYNPETEAVDRVGGINYTIKDGIVWDARALLADVRKLVADEKQGHNK